MRILKISATVVALTIATFTSFAQKIYRIRNVDFKGNTVLSDDELLKQMNTLPKKRLEKLLFWKKPPEFLPSVLKEDISRLTGYYNRNGFLNPVITSETDTSRSGKLIDITIHIKENHFVSVDKIDIILNGDSTDQHLIDSVRKLIPLKSGERFIDEKVFETQTLLKKTFSDHGYPFLKVINKIKLKENNTLADVTFNIDEGNKSYFGDISITGDSLISEKIIRKYILFKEGQPYSKKKMDKSQQDLFSTNLFRYVVISSLTDSVDRNMIPVKILLKELPLWTLETGMGYGTEDKIRLSAQLTKLNFLGGARKLIINGKTSWFMPFSLDARFVQPDVLIPKMDFVFNPFIRQEREVSYRIDRGGGGLSLIYQLSKNLNANITYAFERDRILKLYDLQLDSTELKHNKSAFSIGSQVNSTDDPFYPSKGYKINANLLYSGIGQISALHYYMIDLSVMNYFLMAKELVFASKIRAAIISSTRSDQETPIEERFFLGGASSLRGWGRHKITPANESGVGVGGNTVVEGSAELRFPIYDIFSGVAFMDAGNVWAGTYQFGPVLHYNAGLGMRIKTPIGPIRLDFATPVINDRFNLQFFISVGNAF